MKPIKFDEDCVIFSKDQPEYEDLPVLIVNYTDGTRGHISAWKLNLIERLKILIGIPIYLVILGNQPPIWLTVEKADFLTPALEGVE